ncbi:low temperature requirement protein A [Streptomyces hyaluromycini]|uniref:low temperature requirement protein A n=1 Tax=Streptomyces hyaluromycini TaxID=1377993 RepID=UPI001237BBA1|nr:low temperature requirement protein A [Streptomyces hyaluromycini]
MPEAFERWARPRRLLWQPPRPHGEQPLERAVSPLELLYDLVVVVLVGEAAHHLSAHLSWRGLAEFAAMFTLIWIVWLNGSLYHDLYGREDARGRTALLVQILAMVPLGAFIPQASGSGGFAFSVSAAVLFAVLALVWLSAERGTSAEYRRSSQVFVGGTIACAALLAATALLPADTRLAVWLLLDLLYLAGLSVMIGTAPPGLTITPALIERSGLFTIIVLGETVLGVVDGLARESADALTIAVGLVAVMIGFGVWWTYFDFVGRRPPRPTRAATVHWIVAHLPLTAAVTAMGAAMPGLVEHAHDGRTSPPSRGCCVPPQSSRSPPRWPCRRALRHGAPTVRCIAPRLRRGGSPLPGTCRRPTGSTASRPCPRGPARRSLGRRRHPPDGERHGRRVAAASPTPSLA